MNDLERMKEIADLLMEGESEIPVREFAHDLRDEGFTFETREKFFKEIKEIGYKVNPWNKVVPI